MLALAAHIALSYCTLLPFLGFFIRLTKSIILNDALTLFYAIVYWAPFSFVMNVYARLFLSRKVATFRSTRPSFLKKGAYEYSAATDIFYSKDYSNLDDSLEEWGAVEYLPFVYNAVLNKYNTRLNFKQDLHGPLLDLVAHSTDDEFRVLDIGPGTGNSTMDISSALRNACVCCLDISERLLKMCKERNPHAYCFKGSMEDTLFEDGSFDVVYNFGGINETDIDKSLAETWRIAKPDSLIVLADENFDATSRLRKLWVVFISNLTFIHSYYWDMTASRPPKQPFPKIRRWLDSHAGEYEVLYDGVKPGLFFTMVIRKTSAKTRERGPQPAIPVFRLVDSGTVMGKASARKAA
ncbi:hypothetical protein EMIHUDRAFT_229045 [Emiliania huxleyi CCMP1516]|uniref:Methyltransferase domain-containing protein n=3 Tax=Emiliania huxleyi TaxID=2903 RepID=A0A0D3KDW2_EMIH1|nr:hypothetical protein EMIHUDRAFT_229045 [Emiliania huxleyi CCMP1516]EOD33947.1 hypothetical protein EMIHUDRAFT_229045 [Emiliania huxleyi CCMP1516]|mmetsp:Transcript_40029/g.118780  ORF Transcript_40029/g.118780 Transcript_40029/m.118780 type:complete len:352 (+) Transcript_40029:125-1180(+)|eukprot:XP_005786376.1 hypothetical protein EMIHUDRAFT_229045 [Emiliania huxleyi CCMP1516]